MSENEAAAAPVAASTTQEVENVVEKETVAETATDNVANETDNKENEAKTDTKEDNHAGSVEETKPEDAKTLYDFSVKDIDGNDVSLAKYKGHPTIVVNVASNCGFTKNNYQQLNELYDKYESQGLRIAAFPCNQFMNQESACEVDIKEFAKKKGVRFDMYSKIAVNGPNTIPLYQWLKNNQKGILGTTSIKWNFTKFLVNKEGIPIKRYAPTTSPSSIEPDIKALLG